MNQAKIAFHLHSNYSDGLYSPKRILEEAKKHDFDYIAICDHNEIGGSLKAQSISNKYGITVIPGVELAFICGGMITELLAYFPDQKKQKSFFDEFLRSNPFMPVFDDPYELKKLVETNNGVVVAPHPMNRKGLVRNKINLDVAAIESVNGENSKKYNKMACDYCGEKGLIGVAGSDLHAKFDTLETFTTARSSGKISTQEILRALGGEKSEITFEIVNGVRNVKGFGFAERMKRTIPHIIFVIKLFVKRIIIRHNY